MFKRIIRKIFDENYFNFLTDMKHLQHTCVGGFKLGFVFKVIRTGC